MRYAPGVIFPFPREWWVDGARLSLAGWPPRAPFGWTTTGRRMAVFMSGTSSPDQAAALIENRLHPVARGWVARARAGDPLD